MGILALQVLHLSASIEPPEGTFTADRSCPRQPTVAGLHVNNEMGQFVM